MRKEDRKNRNTTKICIKEKERKKGSIRGVKEKKRFYKKNEGLP